MVVNTVVTPTTDDVINIAQRYCILKKYSPILLLGSSPCQAPILRGNIGLTKKIQGFLVSVVKKNWCTANFTYFIRWSIYQCLAVPPNAPITVMPHLPPTGHRRGLDHFYVLIPCPLGIFGGLIPGVILDFAKLSQCFCMLVAWASCSNAYIFSISCYTPSENAIHTVRACSQAH